jgi:hypothetical protein
VSCSPNAASPGRPAIDEAELAALEARLRSAADLFDPVPPDLTDAALAAYSFRTLDAELARLTFDSLVEGAGAVRGDTAGPRVLTFTAGGTTIEVELAEGRLVGQLLPAEPAEVEVRFTERSTTVSADALGRFTVEPLDPGPVSLRCRITPDRTIVTDWISTR